MATPANSQASTTGASPLQVFEDSDFWDSTLWDWLVFDTLTLPSKKTSNPLPGLFVKYQGKRTTTMDVKRVQSGQGANTSGLRRDPSDFKFKVHVWNSVMLKDYEYVLHHLLSPISRRNYELKAVSLSHPALRQLGIKALCLKDVTALSREDPSQPAVSEWDFIEFLPAGLLEHQAVKSAASDKGGVGPNLQGTGGTTEAAKAKGSSP